MAKNEDEFGLGGDGRGLGKTDNGPIGGVEGVAAAELRQIIERIERLEEEKKTLADDIKEVLSEAKGRGYDTKIIRVIVRLRKKDANERKEEEAILQLYMQALGMELMDTI